MSKSGEKRSTTKDEPTVDLYASIPDECGHFVIEEATKEPGPKAGTWVRGMKVRGVMSVIKPRSGTRRFYQTLQIAVGGKLNFRMLPEEHPYSIRLIHWRDYPLALEQLSKDSGTIRLVTRDEAELDDDRGGEVDPGWVELLVSGGNWGFIESGNGWPNWSESWYLSGTKSNLDGYDGTVKDWNTTQQNTNGLTKWNHAVSALTGSYENDSDDKGWSVVSKNGTNVAVIHRVVNGTGFIDTWWLASTFTWWGNGDQTAKVTGSVSRSVAQSIRNGFGTSTRFKHTITP